MSLEWGNRSKEGAQRRATDMSRRAPSNSKLSHVSSRVNTGNTIQKLQSTTARQRSLRLDENFFRIAPTELNDLLEEYEEADRDEDVKVNVGHFTDFNPRIVSHDAEAKPEVDRPYLILDTRELDEFREAHIVQSVSFPQRALMQDKSSSALVKFKSSEGKLIVLYDDSQGNRTAAAAAQILSTRGFDNVYVLSGGLSGFASKHPRNVEGTLHTENQSQSREAKGGGGGIQALLGKNNSSSGSSGRQGSEGGRGGSSRSQYGGSQAAPSAKSSALASMREQARSSSLGSGGSQLGSARDGYGGGGSGSLASARSRLGSESGKLNSLALSRLQPGGGSGGRSGGYGARKQNPALNEDDERMSRMSGASVAESVISRAQHRKVGMSARYR